MRKLSLGVKNGDHEPGCASWLFRLSPGSRAVMEPRDPPGLALDGELREWFKPWLILL